MSELWSKGSAENISDVSDVKEDTFWNRKSQAEIGEAKEAQEIGEEFYRNSVEHIYRDEHKYMPPETIERLKKGPDSLKIKPYVEDSGILGGHYNHAGYSEINVYNVSNEQMERTMYHEVNHFASFNKEIPIDRGTGRECLSKISGVRTTEVYLSEDGEIGGIIDDSHRGMNEGITQMFTYRHLGEVSPEKELDARREDCYGNATVLCEALRDAVGEEVIKKAYYSGDIQGLRDVIDRHAGPNSFERLSKDMDRATYNDDYAVRIEAMRDAQSILADVWEGAGRNA